MKKLIIYLGFLLMVFAINVYASTPEEAKEELHEKSIEYTKENFIESSKNGDLAAVKLRSCGQHDGAIRKQQKP